MRYFIFILLLSVTSCERKADFSTPAQSQIDEYTAKLKACKAPPEAKKEPTVAKAPIQKNLLEIREGDIVLGDPNSKIVVTEYFSPTCTHCAYFDKEIFPKLKKIYIDNGKIAYVIREYITNKQDLDAAILARCHKDKDLFLKFTSTLLQTQHSWASSRTYRDTLFNVAMVGGVSYEEYKACLDDNDLVKFLIDNSRIVSSIPGFRGTPSFFVNGILFNGSYSLEALSKAIDEAP